MPTAYRSKTRLSAAYTILLFPFLVFRSADVVAACNTTGLSTVCDASVPNPATGMIGTGPNASEDNRTITVGAGSSLAVGDSSAISVENSANITVSGNVSATAVSSQGLYGTGANAIDFLNNSKLTVQQGGQVVTLGTEAYGEPINVEGSGNSIVNSGLIKGTHSVAIWFQNTSGANTVINSPTGIIQAPGNVIGSSGNGAVDFTNYGQVIGDLNFGGGDDVLRLYTGSSISGSFSGGGGNNSIFLNGLGASSLPGNFTQFQSLYKQDSGTWTLTGTITGVTLSEVQAGTLVLTGNNNSYTGRLLVDASGTLEARAQSLPLSISDNGLVRFVQPDAGTYTGLLDGTGSVEKTGAGTLTLAPTAPAGNTYSGGTTITQGTVALAADNALGAATGALTFNGGTLQLTRNLDLAATRAVSVNAPGGTFDTQAFTSTVAQGITGTGQLTKAGTGSLTLTGTNTYTGGTTIAAGTLRLGNGVTSGSITGDVMDNGALLFDRSDVAGYAGTISGSGAVNQAGVGTTVLTGASTYTGGTSISAGTLQLGSSGTSGSIVGDVTDNGQLAFDRSDVAGFAGTISGTGSVSQIGSGTTVLTGANTYNGGTAVQTGTLVVGDSAHPSATIGAGSTTVAHGATLGGYGTVLGSVDNAGVVATANALPFTSGSPSGTFTIAGDFTNRGVAQLGVTGNTIGNVLNVGSNYTGVGGTLRLNTLLNQGGAASQSDRLVVNGNTTGNTAIQINKAGSGAQTVADGIQLVQVNGNSAAGSFALGAPVQAGAYQYLLYRGGASTPSDWYLRTTLETAPGVPPTTPATPAAPGNPPSLAAPAYRPATVGYTMTPLLNLDYGFSILGRLHERVGDVASLSAVQPGSKDGVWGRIGGESLDANSDDRFSSDERTFFAQLGKDWTLDNAPAGGSTHAGVTVTLGSTSASFEDSARNINAQLSNTTGSVETQAQSVGGYWTKYLSDGTYFDGVGQLTHYHNKYGDIYSDNAAQNGYGAGASGEIGKPFVLGSTRIAIEPQAQLLYQYVHLNATKDAISSVSANSTNALRGRLGFRLFTANLSNNSKDGAATPYFTANVLHDFFSPGQTEVGNASFDSGMNKTWYELGVGVTTSAGKNSELYANVKYSRNFSGAYRQGVYGQAGYRYSW